MIYINKKHRALLSAVMTIVLLSHLGCKPTARIESASSGKTALEPTADRLAVKTENKAPELDIEPVVIDGDLSSVDWRSMVGQNVTIDGELVVVDTYDLARRGQFKVARGRLFIPTERIDPNDSDAQATSFEGGSNVAKVIAAQKLNESATITLDDGSADENIFPPTLFPNLGMTHPTVRIGSVLKGVSGELVMERNNIFLVPSEPLQWTPAERPQRPDVGEPDVTVASFNVLNYFTTIDNRSNNARGADSESELARQEAKLVSAIIALQADVIGLMELENNLDAETRLIAALNREIGQDAFVGCGIPNGFREAPGGQDAIRVGIIYRADHVSPAEDVSMVRDEAFELARTPIVQRFKTRSSDNSFALIVNHFKSKGGSDRAEEVNKNKGDGQAAYNTARRSQSLAICNYIAGLKQGEEEPRVLVIGDLNAYGQEDPIDAMRANGLVDLREHMKARNALENSGGHYSYIYYGQCGSLDHAMATGPLAADVTGIATWHINSDEPRFVDYNEEHNPTSLYEANPFRSSDHDPVIIGIK